MRTEGHQRYLIDKPGLWGIAAGLSLLVMYFLILSIAESYRHSIEQFAEIWPWISVLVLGFAVQAALYSFIRREMKIKKEAGIAGPAVATAGGISTTSMVACCAHHLTDVLPLVGASAAAVFLSQYQSVFLTAGVLSNLVGITLMLKIIQKQGLYRQKQTILSALMRLNMTRSFYAVCALSIVTLLVTLYQSF